jgi:hypothetical protein
MSDHKEQAEVFLDLLPNQPKNNQNRESFRELLRQKFEQRLPDAVERIWELPPIILTKRNEEYLSLLLEARQLHIEGYFYSCVAMCGIVGERLVKDVFRASVLVQKNGHPQSPPEVAFDQFERVDVNGMVRFLKESDLLSVEAAKAASDLGELRNQYAHARGKKPDGDALEAIKLLHVLVKGTVSVFKDFEIRDGALVRKADVQKDKL